MFSEQTNSTILWSLFAAAVAMVAVFMRRIAADRMGATRPKQTHDDEALQSAARRVYDRIAKLELRLHDYHRQVEGSLETRLARLDELILSADREIARLTELVRSARTIARERMPDVIIGDSFCGNISMVLPGDPSLDEMQIPLETRRMIGNLREAGFSVAQVAKMVDRTVNEVESVLRHDSSGSYRDAA